jgi:hypothetical protein
MVQCGDRYNTMVFCLAHGFHSGGSSDSHSDHFSSGINRWASTSTSDNGGADQDLRH